VFGALPEYHGSSAYPSLAYELLGTRASGTGFSRSAPLQLVSKGRSRRTLRQPLFELCLELAGTCRANGNIPELRQYLGCVAANRLHATVFRKVVHAFCARRVGQHLGRASPCFILPIILRRATFGRPSPLKCKRLADGGLVPTPGCAINRRARSRCSAQVARSYRVRRSHPGVAEIQSDESITAFASLSAIQTRSTYAGE
jgi:hypothetical protein